jgi:ABC-type histidine transport system ATPase subunit
MKTCYTAAEILLPDFQTTDAARWAVVACDQFTSEKEYWENADRIVGDAPSTLRMILPEVYLSETEQRIPDIQKTMREYLQTELQTHSDAMIYVERTQSDGSIRRGIVMAIDLESYDYRKGASALIRATEATVVERIPPRVAIRRGAAIELPHVMLLIDDVQRSVIEPLSQSAEGSVAYDTDLMLGGGHLFGRFLSEREQKQVSRALESLITPEQMQVRYGDAALAPLLFAVGDGNHSLASAKAAYEEIKEKIGFVSAGMTYYTRKKLKAITAVTKTFYPAWDDEAYRQYMSAFGLDEEKTPAELSNGMKIKYALALALSHGAELLILDEPTSGLDPVSREELVEVFLRLKDEGKTVFFSTHITSDLEKCADRILFLQRGELKADDDLPF